MTLDAYRTRVRLLPVAMHDYREDFEVALSLTEDSRHYNLALVQCRSTLQHLLTEAWQLQTGVKNPGDVTLKTILEQLMSKKVLSQEIQAICEPIKVYGDKAAHVRFELPIKQLVFQSLDNLLLVFSWFARDILPLRKTDPLRSRVDALVFHTVADKTAASGIVARLAPLGLHLELVDETTLNQSIDKQLGASRIVLILFGPGGGGVWQSEKVNEVLTRQVKLALHRIIPVRLPDAERPEYSFLPEYLRTPQWIEFGTTLDEDKLGELSIRILGADPRLRFHPPASDKEFQPYRGLMAYGVADAPLYFGREAQVDWLLDTIRTRRDPAQEHRFLALIGASGSGKSSLCLAGVVASLRANALGWSEGWPVAICRPGSEPLLNLAISLTGLSRLDPGDLRRRFADEPDRLHVTVTTSLYEANPAIRALIVVDQFEELFTECLDPAVRTAFVQNLCHAASVRRGRTIVVLTMRDDFFGRCAEFPELRALLRSRTELVSPLVEDQLIRAIEQPARLGGASVAPELTQTLLREMKNQPHGLPLLEHLLEQMWRQRRGSELTLETYEAVGGLRGALERHADEIFDTLCESDREIARSVFIRLTRPGAWDPRSEVTVVDDTKRRVQSIDLYPADGRRESVDCVVRRLADERLVSMGAGEDQQVWVEVAHEELIRSWPRLRGWLESDRNDFRIHHDLTLAAERWGREARSAGYLVHGEQLELFARWATQYAHQINKSEREFLQASMRSAIRQISLVDPTEWRQGLLDVSRYHPFSVPILRELLAESRPGSRQHRFFALGLVPHDENLVSILEEELLGALGVEFHLIRDAMKPHIAQHIDRLWQLAIDPVTADGRILRLAMALAEYSPPSDPRLASKWNVLLDRLPGCLLNDVSEHPDHYTPWIAGFEVLREPLKLKTMRLFETEKDPYRKSWACRLGVAFAAADVDLLGEMLWRADFDLIPIIWEAWKNHRPFAERAALARLDQATEIANPQVPNGSADRTATNAAIALFRFNEVELDPFPALRHRPNSQVRTNLIDRAPSIEIEYARLWERYRTESDVSIQRAILLAMRNYESERARTGEPADAQEVIVREFRTHPDSGVHAACQSLIRFRNWSAPELPRGLDVGERNWFVNSEGQTFAVIQGTPFQMGSRADDADAQPNEQLHRRILTRRFAVGTTQVTRAEYRRFTSQTGAENLADNDYIRSIVRTDDSPMTFVRWYEAAEYCNWLSHRDGIPESEWCYRPNDRGVYGPGMRFADEYLARTGYRLPTEAEWEFAARAGAETRFPFGNDVKSLLDYAWYSQSTGGESVRPVATKHPNDFGLFDMLGNAWEWCNDRYLPYRDNIGDAVDDTPISNDETRILRGGAYVNVPAHVRCACRNHINKPDHRFHPLGFRVARTIS